MNSHNIAKYIREESISVESRDRRASLPADNADDAGLAIDDSFDLGGDPYNTTGRHVIIKSKISQED